MSTEVLMGTGPPGRVKVIFRLPPDVREAFALYCRIVGKTEQEVFERLVRHELEQRHDLKEVMEKIEEIRERERSDDDGKASTEKN